MFVHSEHSSDVLAYSSVYIYILETHNSVSIRVICTYMYMYICVYIVGVVCADK